MAKVPQKFRDKADYLIDYYDKLKTFQIRYEEMSRLQYALPDPLSKFDWIRPVITTAPYDALRGATRALSNLKDALNIHPVSVLKALGDVDDEAMEAKALANSWETALKWQLNRASKRRKKFESDAVWSVSVYDEVVSRLIHLPTQFKAIGLKGPRKAAAMRFGDWALRIDDVKAYYVEYSDYMIESFLSIQVKTAREMVAQWGGKASGIKRKMSGGKTEAKDIYLELEYIDHEDGRVVWYQEGPAIDMDKGGALLLGPEPWLKIAGTNKQVPFLPIIASAGGTVVDKAPEHQRKPILYPVLMAEQWATANIAATVMMSQQFATAASATDVIKGIGVDQVEFDHTEPRRRVELTAFQEYQQVQDAGMDAGIREVFDRLEGAIQRTTVADVLVTAQPISGEQSFASYNLQVQQALASIGGVKEVSERFFEEVHEKMLLITHYTGGEIVGYGKGLDKYTIDSEDINPESIHLEVELKADVPTDRLQRVNAATTMAKALNYPMTRILRMLGETDPEGALREWKLEQLDLTHWQGILERERAKASGELEQLALQMAQEILAQQQLQQPQGGGGAPLSPEQAGELSNAPTGPAGTPLEGQGVNPAAGGLPPSLASPEGATFEGQRGARPSGEEIAGF